MEKTYDFLSVGEVLIDMTPAKTESGEACFLPKVGGAPVNAACVLAKLGKHAAFTGRMGHDAFGEQIEGTLSAAGLDTALLQRDEERHTTLAFVHLSPEGDRSFSFYRTGLADTRLEASENALRAAERTKILHFGSVALAEEPERTAVLTIVQRGKEAGAWISYDPNLRSGLWRDREEMRRAVRDTMPFADILKLSEEEAEELLGIAEPEKAALDAWERYGCKLVFVTCGSGGAWGCCGGKTAFAPALPVQAVDTTGAGDCFLGAACYGLLSREEPTLKLNRKELEDLLRFACTAGSLATKKRGAIDAIPTLAEIESAMKTGK